MPSADHDATDDDELALYVAAFRTVEHPSAASRDASWRAIASQTAEPKRVWLWVGAAVVLAAAAIMLWSAGAMQQLFAIDDTSMRDQAGYVPMADDEPLPALAKRPEPVRREPAPAPADPPTAAPETLDAPAPPEEKRPRKRDEKPAPSLAEETALFGEIQQALVGGEASRALGLIAKHERDFPRGAFRQERTVAKAQALCAAGKREAARSLRDKFLERYPASHLAARMRAVCPG